MFEIIPNWHPIFVHYTVALLSLSVGLFVVLPLVKSPLKEQWITVARWSLWFGAASAIVTGLTGLYAYNTVAHDTPSHLAMTDHRNWAIVTISLFLVLASWSIVLVRRKGRVLGMAFLIFMLAGGGLLASTAWHGGEAVYRYGLGVMSLPKAEGGGHSHSHGDGQGHGEESTNDLEMDFRDMEDEFGGDDGHDHVH